MLSPLAGVFPSNAADFRPVLTNPRHSGQKGRKTHELVAKVCPIAAIKTTNTACSSRQPVA